jgi:septum formation protein
MPDQRLILASGSPRRRELLTDAGYRFDVVPSDVDESAAPDGLGPSDVAMHLARAKGRAVAAKHPGAVVLSADTVVALGAQLLGKPTDAADARRMLKLLSGTTQVVSTGVVVIAHGHENARVVSSTVSMRQLTDAEVNAYVASKRWEGKAGGYGIQDDDPFVTRTDGSHTNIVGLPMETTTEMLADVGVHPVPL